MGEVEAQTLLLDEGTCRKRLGLHLHGFARFPCVPRTFTLLLHLLDEPFLIDFKAVILCIFLRQLIRESICVIEPECFNGGRGSV